MQWSKLDYAMTRANGPRGSGDVTILPAVAGGALPALGGPAASRS